MMRLALLPACVRRVLVPGVAGLVLGGLPGAGLLLWADHHAPSPMHSAEPDAFPATYRVKSLRGASVPWETPKG